MNSIEKSFIEAIKKIAKQYNIDKPDIFHEIKSTDYRLWRSNLSKEKRKQYPHNEHIQELGGFKRLMLRHFSTKPKILIFDIETAPLIGYVWGLWKNDIGLNMLKNDWYVLSWAAKWLNEREVIYKDQRRVKDIENDKNLLKGLWRLLDQADIVITHNGINFDVKRLNTRFALHGMEPPSNFRHIDTYKIARKYFGFTSNKLEYLTDKLCTKHKKLTTKKFTGFNLWRECLAGNKLAWEEMEKYNKLDVLSLEELYYRLIPWDSSLNFSVYTSVNTCACGSTHFKKAGFYHTTKGRFQRYKCKACGRNTRDSGNRIPLSRRKEMFTNVVR